MSSKLYPTNNNDVAANALRINVEREKRIDLEGLNEEETKELFTELVVDEHLKNPVEKTKIKINLLLRKTGGHPLSIELIAKNITSVEELEEMSQSLGSFSTYCFQLV